MKILSWNCKGFDIRPKSEALRDLIKLEKPIVIMLQETKMDELDIIQEGKKYLKHNEGVSIS
jgi:exonuclease III